MRGFAFPKSARLLRRREFLAVAKEHKRLVGQWIVADVRPNVMGRTRLGISVSKKFGNAVARNRIKRRIREAFRHSCCRLPQGIDICIVPKKTASRATFQDIREELVQLLACWR